jgi:rSAM/selenodomain-associated transferase 1
VVVFAREPLPGRVKTRLAAAIGEGAAASVYAALLERTVAVAAGTDFDLVVSYAEAPSPAWTADLTQRWEVQRGGDLGERMRDAFDRRFGEGRECVVVVGSDCPPLQQEHLADAADALENVPVVIGPATDGGYWLVAQRRPGRDLFSGIPWSSPNTMDATRERLATLAVDWVELDEFYDIDTETDLHAALADPDLDPDLRERFVNALQE